MAGEKRAENWFTAIPISVREDKMYIHGERYIYLRE